MEEKKSHEDKHKHHEHHSHTKKDDKLKFEISKVRIWQGLTAILVIVVVFMWFSSGSESGVAPQLPQAQPSPSAAPPPTGNQDIDLDDDPVLGNANAPVTIVSFEDYQCPFCGRAFQQTLPLLKKDYVDKGIVKLAFRDYPLGFHPEAQPAAEASECADDQGKFWEYHDALFQNQQSLSSALYTQLAEQLDLDVEQFNQCLQSGKFRQEVQDDFRAGSSAGVSGTPTFFIGMSKENANVELLQQFHDGRNIIYGESSNGEDVVMKLVGALPYPAFQQIIEAGLANQ